MRIVHVCSYYAEPFARGYQVYQLAKAQVADGNEVHIITCNKEINLREYQAYAKRVNNQDDLSEHFSRSETGANIHRLKVSLSVSGRNWWAGFEDKLKELNPELLIIHNVLEFQSIRVLFYRKSVQCPIIFDDHTTINVVRTGPLSDISYGIFRLFIAGRLYNRAQKIIGISSSVMDVLHDKFGLKGPKVQMVSLGTDTKIYFPDREKREHYRKGLNISDQTVLIVYTGKMNHSKKAHLIIEAVSHINRNNSHDVFILLAGFLEPDYEEMLKGIISTSFSPVKLTGNVTHSTLAEIYNAADIAVWPAHSTISTLDASACGCPIICSEYKRERFKNNNGIGIKDGDLPDLVSALENLINNQQLRVEMGRRGQELIQQEFSWDVISRKFIEP